MSISVGGALGGASTGALTGASIGKMLGPAGLLPGAAIGGIAGGLLGLFSGKSLSKEEKAILKRLEDMAGQQQGLATQQLDAGNKRGATYDQMAKGARGGANQQAYDYWSSLLGGDRAKMQMAVAPARAQIADTYKGGKKAIDKSNLRGAQRDQAQAELSRQQTGQLAGLVQGVQPMAAQELSALEAQIQQIMGQYFGLGEQARGTGAASAASLFAGAGDNLRTSLGTRGNLRDAQAANDRAMGGAVGSLLGPLSGQGPASTARTPAFGAAPTPSGWTLPRPTWAPTTAAGQSAQGMNYFNATTTKARNPWSNNLFGG